MLSSDPGIDVVATAPDAYIAREKIKALNPDVITLDIEMPKMDGLTFLSNLMRLRPTPVVMISTLTQKGAQASLEALHIGAVDYVGKPQSDVSSNLEAYATEIIEKVKMAAVANIAALARRNRGEALERRLSIRDAVSDEVLSRSALQRIVAIGASTGGTEAIAEVLAGMPANSPPVVIAQHIPEMFSRSFSERVNKLSPMQVSEARDGERALAGHAYVAPGNHHLRLRRNGSDYVCTLDQEPPVNRHRPSVDVLFESVARAAGSKAVGVMLTGMGSDGARGMKALKEAGGRTLAQDKATSVVWGMPGSAVEIGAVDKIVALETVSGEIIRLVKAST
jgi:two-component system chemotaxis response regulator CheB